MRFLCVCLPARQAGGQPQRSGPPLRLKDAAAVADAAQAEAGLTVMLIRPAGEAISGDVILHVLIMQEMHAVHHAYDAPRGGFWLFTAHDHHRDAFRRCQQVERLVVSGAVVIAVQEAQVHLVFLSVHVSLPFSAAGRRFGLVAVPVAMVAVGWQPQWHSHMRGKPWDGRLSAILMVAVAVRVCFLYILYNLCTLYLIPIFTYILFSPAK